MALAAKPKVRRCEKCFARLCADESELTHTFNGRCRANPPAAVKTKVKRRPRRNADSWYALEF